MTDDFDTLRQRQDQTEGRVIVLEDDARIQKRAFADMDRDVSDLRVQWAKQKQMLQSVGETLSDHTKRLMRLETGMTEVRTKVIQLETGMTEVKTELGVVHEGIDTIIDLLNKAS